MILDLFARIRIPPRHDLMRPRVSDIEKARFFARRVERRFRRRLRFTIH